MSTISPVTSFVAAASAFSCSSASASGAVASAAVKASATAIFINFGTLSVVEYMPATFSLIAGRSIARLAPVAFDETRECGEKIAGVMRAGRRLGMVLHAEDGQLAMTHSLDCAVVQIYVRYFNFRRERIGIDRKAVILRSDRNFARR